jgi:hypothetical protein
MFDSARIKVGALALMGFSWTLAMLALGGSGIAAAPGCGAFKAQGDAQDSFLEHGGSPRRDVGRMDPDGDGVACEGLPAPYKGYATIGYNRKREFFYGTATMPVGADGRPGYPCLYGNRHFHRAARKVNIFRVTPKGDVPLIGEYRGAVEALPGSGRLIWKAEKENLEPGRYYAAFEERIRTTPYGRNECPGFSSKPALLPRPRD